MAKDLFEKAFSAFDDVPDTTLLSESSLSLVDSWIDTGSYALNAIVSGSVFRGLPKGRIVIFTGPSGCGKTLMTLKAVGNFQKTEPEGHAVVFDSEIAVDMQTAKNLGCKVEYIKHIPSHTITGVRNQCLKFLDQVIENDLKGKFVIDIDSLGNLASTKEIDDALADKDASDMGLRAKQIKSMLRVLTYRTAVAKTTILVTNHTYKDPMAMYPTAVQMQSGGEGPVYMASVVIQLGFKREKNEKDYEDEQILAAAKKVGGITIHALTAKNRFIPGMLETDLYLNFKTGLDKYSGLFELAKGLGVITGDINYTLNGQNIGRRKDFERNADFWETKGLKLLDEKLKKEFIFSSDADKLKQEIAKI